MTLSGFSGFDEGYKIPRREEEVTIADSSSRYGASWDLS
jgi:hypothetical protein